MLKIVSHCNIQSWLLDCYFIKILYTKLCSVVFRTPALYMRVLCSSLNLLFVLTLVVHIFLAHLHKCSGSTVNSQWALSSTSFLIHSLMIQYSITYQLISSTSQALQFIVDLGFHCSLPLFPVVSGHCVSAFSFPCKVLFYLISPSFA